MKKPVVRPYGTWESPLSAADVAGKHIHIGQSQIDGDRLYQSEVNPAEGGKSIIYCHCLKDGTIRRITKPDFNARTRAREYGGGSMVAGHGVLAACNWDDQRMVLLDDHGETRLLTPDSVKEIPGVSKPIPSLRFADGIVDVHRKRIIAICEDITLGINKPVYSIVGILLNGSQEIQTLVAGHSGDMYMSPALSPDSGHLAFIAWTPPAMPWRSSRLMVGEFRENGTVNPLRRKAGGEKESIAQPLWSQEDNLCYVSDKSGYWNPWCINHEKQAEQLLIMESDFAQPQWVFGMSHGVSVGDSLICSYIRDGIWKLGELPHTGMSMKEFDLPFTEIHGVRANETTIFFVGASPTQPAALVALDRRTREWRILRHSSSDVINPDFVSTPEWVTTSMEDGLPVYGWFYSPKNSNFVGPEGELPPVYVDIHGGPEESASTEYNPEVQFWTTRGVAVLSVDYPGSTRYGRAYRDALIGRWGEVDRLAARSLVTHVAKQGKVDGRRAIIGGWSAGGYTALNEMANGTEFFAGAVAAASLADLFELAEKTGGFEGGNIQTLVGDVRDVERWKARSPLFQRQNIRKPIFFLHGQDDFVTPLGQIDAMVGALQEQGVPVATFFPEKETHGFRRAENIQRAMEAQLVFFGKVCGFEPADDIVDPLEIFNVELIPVVDFI